MNFSISGKLMQQNQSLLGVDATNFLEKKISIWSQKMFDNYYISYLHLQASKLGGD